MLALSPSYNIYREVFNFSFHVVHCSYIEIQLHLKEEMSLEMQGTGPGYGQGEGANNHTLHKSPREYSHLGQYPKFYDLST